MTNQNGEKDRQSASQMKKKSSWKETSFVHLIKHPWTTKEIFKNYFQEKRNIDPIINLREFPVERDPTPLTWTSL